uniref:Uncharacterized protein n=1 Tax=Branchiostoma floridae TaxID=7739 RepID=C3ZQP2_BRAFL|eukprot:XP_002589077.1 hypothetical protein BRAFLDRAFT_120895 [Branchiostoma floridae]
MAQLKIQAYLDKHKISALFEEMMSKLIQEQPEEPLPYLSRMIDRKWEKIRPKRSRENSPARMRTAPSPSALRKSMPAGAATWAGNSEGAVAKDREYDRPWLTNAKRSRSKGRSGVEGHDNIRPEKKDKATWNPNTQKVPTGDFDELFKLTKGSKGMKGSKSVDFAMLQAQLGKDVDESLRHSQPIYYGQPRDQALREEDSLSSELKAPMSSRSGEEESSSVDLELRTVKPHQHSLQHKRQLEAIVKQKETASDSGLEEPEDDEEYEEGLELLENADDLAKEGVTNVVQSGHKISSPMGKRLTPTQKSVGEVLLKPRAPVWYAEESETEVSRKGAHMLTKDPRPVKGRPMFSCNSCEVPVNTTAVTPVRGPCKYHSCNTCEVLVNTTAVTPDEVVDPMSALPPSLSGRPWSPPPGSDCASDENGTVKSATALSLGGRSWHAPPETDAESVDFDRDRGHVLHTSAIKIKDRNIFNHTFHYLSSPEPHQKPLALPAPPTSGEKQTRPTSTSALTVTLKDDLSDFGDRKTKSTRAFALPKDDSEDEVVDPMSALPPSLSGRPWSPPPGSDCASDENGTVKSATALSLGGRSWHAPPETDAESVDFDRDRGP